MKDKRKQIILTEIAYWKKHQLLPGHYCDFLSTLYSEGRESASIHKKERSYFENEQRKQYFSMISGITYFMISMSFLLFLNNEWALIMSGLMIVLFAGTILKKTLHKELISPVLHMLLAVIILAFTLKIWTLYFYSMFVLLSILIALNCIVWFFVGRYFRLIYLTISGVIGLILTFIFMLI